MVSASRSAPPAFTPAVTSLLGRAGLWPLRAVWFSAPLGIGLGLATSIDRFDGAGATVAEVALWAGWFVGLVATLVPTTVSLTAVRISAPATIGLLVLAGVADGWSGRQFEAMGYGAFLTVVAYLPVTGDAMINASAYGSERRMALRPPAFSLLGPVQLAWALVFAGLVTGPLLAANNHYVVGGLATVAGVGACWLGGRVLHQLSRRWIVFVPAGFVIHDHVLLVESILMRRATIAALGPATSPVPETAVDLSGGAYGLALEVSTREPVSFGRRVYRTIVNIETDRIIFTPTLPGAVLTEARIRAIRIGSPEGSVTAHEDPDA